MKSKRVDIHLALIIILLIFIILLFSPLKSKINNINLAAEYYPTEEEQSSGSGGSGDSCSSNNGFFGSTQCIEGDIWQRYHSCDYVAPTGDDQQLFEPTGLAIGGGDGCVCNGDPWLIVDYCGTNGCTDEGASGDSECNPPESCTDTDGAVISLGVYEQGTVSGVQNGEEFTFIDHCNNNQLIEYHCVGDIPVDPFTINCADYGPFECTNGACTLTVNSNIVLDVETISDFYNTGDYVELTDPPGAKPSSSKTTTLVPDTKPILNPSDKQSVINLRNYIKEKGETKTIQGKVTYGILDNFEKQSSETYTLVQTTDGEFHTLIGPQNFAPKIGTEVSLTGKELDNEVVLDSYQIIKEPVQETSPFKLNYQETHESLDIIQTSTQSSISTLGEQKTLAILVKFSDDTDSRPFTREYLYPLLFGTPQQEQWSLNSFIKEASYEQTWVTGNVLDWRQIPMTSTEFFQSGNMLTSMVTLLNHAINSVANEVDLTSAGYTRIIVVTRYYQNEDSGHPALSILNANYNIGGVPVELTTSWAMLKNDIHKIRKDIAHEFGHQLGLLHANDLECGTETIGDIGTGCASIEYGDFYETMGPAPQIHFNLAHKDKLRWLNGPNSILNNPPQGIYKIYPLELNDAKLKGIKIPRPDGLNYFIEFRKRIGFDFQLPSQERLSGAMIRTDEEYITFDHFSDSQLLDMSPYINHEGYKQTTDSEEVVLRRGNTFEDEYGVRITIPNSNNFVEYLEVEIGSVTCTDSDDQDAPPGTLAPAADSFLFKGRTQQHYNEWLYDTCLTDSKLKEYFCSPNGALAYTEVDCGEGFFCDNLPFASNIPTQTGFCRATYELDCTDTDDINTPPGHEAPSYASIFIPGRVHCDGGNCRANSDHCKSDDPTNTIIGERYCKPSSNRAWTKYITCPENYICNNLEDDGSIMYASCIQNCAEICAEDQTCFECESCGESTYPGEGTCENYLNQVTCEADSCRLKDSGAVPICKWDYDQTIYRDGFCKTAVKSQIRNFASQEAKGYLELTVDKGEGYGYNWQPHAVILSDFLDEPPTRVIPPNGGTLALDHIWNEQTGFTTSEPGIYKVLVKFKMGLEEWENEYVFEVE